MLKRQYLQYLFHGPRVKIGGASRKKKAFSEAAKYQVSHLAIVCDEGGGDLVNLEPQAKLNDP